MARVPKYRRHKNGAAFVEHGGKRTYLGRHGTDDSRKRYRQFLERLEVAQQASAAAKSPVRLPTGDRILVCELVNAYLSFAETYYVGTNGKPNTEFSGMKLAGEHLDAAFGEEFASTFGPRKLTEFQCYLVNKGLPRVYVNKIVGRVKRIFQWCSQQELVRPEMYAGLKCVAALRKGRTTAPEKPKIKPADMNDVAATLPWLAGVLADMVQVQFYCGMRPSEVCRMTPGEINRTGPIWIYQPADHKNAWRGLVRLIAIPKIAQPIVAKYLDRPAAAALFSPRESEKRRNDERTGKVSSTRKTKVYPSEMKARAKAKLARRATAQSRLRTQYDRDSYRSAIEYAFVKAEKNGVIIPKWHPNQLRHSIATDISKRFGRQAAQYWLGHEHLETTGIYAEKQVSELIAIAHKVDEMLAETSPTSPDVLPLLAKASSA